MATTSEEARMAALNEESSTDLKAYSKIPYALISGEVEGSSYDVLNELGEICGYYKIYNKGMQFTPEGSNGDYVPSNLTYKITATLINKEARFLFAESPLIQVEPKGDVGMITDGAKDALTVLNDLVKTVLDKNNFEEKLIKAARDCFIGKRVAGLVNFNEEDGVTVNFLPSTQFLFETKLGNDNVLTKFIAFIVVKESTAAGDRRIFKKKYELIDDVVYLEENIYDGAGQVIEEVTKKTALDIDFIPAVVFLNDGLTGDRDGESEVEILKDYEAWYSKLSNIDIDAERKSMNPIKYAIDMDSNSTKNLSTAAGSFWDLGSDQNLEHPATQVGMLEPNMSYSAALKTSLDRLKTTTYEQVDMPNVTLETMTGAITSGKALQAVYWPLIVRCKEKMKMWGPCLQTLVDYIIRGSMAYPNTTVDLITDVIIPVDYEVKVEQKTPLPEDEVEQKNMDLAEVMNQTMSRKSFMIKWRGLTEEEVADELQQIAVERQIFEDSFYNLSEMGFEDAQSMTDPSIGADASYDEQEFDDFSYDYIEGEEDIDPFEEDGIGEAERKSQESVLAMLDELLAEAM